MAVEEKQYYYKADGAGGGSTDSAAMQDGYQEDFAADDDFQAVLVDGNSSLTARRKKRNTKRTVIIGVLILIAALVAGALIVNAVRGPAAKQMEMKTVEKGDITQTLNTSGALSSGDKVTIFSPVTAPIAEVKVEAGSRVKAGDLLFTYDTTDLERSLRSAEAAYSLQNLQAKQTLDLSAESTLQAANAQTAIDSLNSQRGPLQTQAKNLDKQMQQYLAENSGILKDLENDLAGAVEGTAEYDEILKKYNDIVRQGGAIQSKLTATQQELSYMGDLTQQLQGAKDAAEMGILGDMGRQAMSLQAVSPEMAVEMAREDLQAARQGITAPISGVVTMGMDSGGMEDFASAGALGAPQAGSAVTQYGTLCTIESLDKVNVRVSLSRFDLERVEVGQSATVTFLGKEYAAKVTKIDAIAVTETTVSGSSTYVPAVVTLTSPDDELTLGVEADVVINTGRKNNVLAVPITAVNTDVDGTFCYVNADGTAERRRVELGMSGDEMVEIVSGLKAGDEVILSSQNIQPGDAVAKMTKSEAQQKEKEKEEQGFTVTMDDDE